ncbi:MAG: type I-B CRISPR-associated protein Cas7/Csh2 [Epsilonproteobacteria bacterium]|nr:type I-B CRISPR-associated protein Cas7/Csh2 [Campylobacterota bacterium]
MSSNLAKESEILFLWDTRLSNPNGDMMSDNANRFDEVDEKAIISDVRIKRTIRDYLQYHKEYANNIFVNNDAILAGYADEKGATKSVTAENRFSQIKEQFKDIEVIKNIYNEYDKKLQGKTGKEKKKLEDERDNEIEKPVFLNCIDNRLFGGVAPKSGLQLIGATQFSWTKSLNKTETVLSQGTGAFATESKKEDEAKFTKTFRVDNYVPYAIFPVYGTINRANVNSCQTTEKDIKDMLEGLWYGTKKLNTHTKMGQKPRMLLRIIYNDDSNYFIGLLDELVKLKNSSEIRSLDEAEFDFDPLVQAINKAEDFIQSVEVVLDGTMKDYEEKFKEIKKVSLKSELDLFVPKESKE